jgi:hypothetical protein
VPVFIAVSDYTYLVNPLLFNVSQQNIFNLKNQMIYQQESASGSVPVARSIKTATLLFSSCPHRAGK